jgi:hypothetical protein
MRRLIYYLTPAVCGALVALALGGCGESSSTPAGGAAVVHGEPINAAPQTNAPSVAAVQPAVAQPVPATPPPKPESIKAVEAVPAYQTVGFDKLASYNFEVGDDAPVTNAASAPDKADEQIPPAVKAFDHRKVSIKGFMLPLKVQNGSVTEFLIMKDQSMCCYGTVPKITEWVNVKTAGAGIKPIMDQPVSILGTLHVGAMRENGYLIGIYQMDGEKMVDSGN